MKVTFEDRPALHGTRIAIATLDAPRQLNALSLPMIEALLDQLHGGAAPGTAPVTVPSTTAAPVDDMIGDDGAHFDAPIPPFTLSVPRTLH